MCLYSMQGYVYTLNNNIYTFSTCQPIRASPLISQSVAPEEGATGKVIIFTNLRDSVQSIVQALQKHAPLIQAKYVPVVVCL